MALLQEHLTRENTDSLSRDINEGNREIITNRRIMEEQKQNAIRAAAEHQTLAQQSLMRLSNIENKDFSPRITVTSNVSITDITRRLVSFRISQGTNQGGFVE